MKSGILCSLLCLITISTQTQARSRFSRQVTSDEAIEDSPAVAPLRTGQRELFSLTGPSLDFQGGSVMPAPLAGLEGPLKIMRSVERSRAVSLSIDDDYGTFDNRFFDSAITSVKQDDALEKKPIYIKRISLKPKTKVKESSVMETTTEQPMELEETTTIVPSQIEITTEIINADETTTNSEIQSDAVEFDAVEAESSD